MIPLDSGRLSFPFFHSQNKRTKFRSFLKSGLFLACLVSATTWPGNAETKEQPSRHPVTVDEEYRGPHQELFTRLKWEVPILLRQTTIDLSVKLGIPFRDDWRYPLIIRFVDTAPFGIENALAYVEPARSEDQLVQLLNINLSAYEREKFNFPKVLAHELVHAMIIDAVEIEHSRELPLWLHEGLAVFGADQGETMVRSYVYQFTGFAESKLLNGLPGPHGALDYAEDYLAIKYLHDKLGVNALHAFVREVIKRQGDIPGALDATCFMTWQEFQEKAMAFAKEEIQRIGPAIWGKQERPY